MKYIITILKRVVFAFCIIYLFDLVAAGLNIFIPINIITLTVTSFLGTSGLIALIGVFFILK